ASIVGSTRSRRIAFSARRVPPKSASIREWNPATSAARIAARRRSTGCFMASLSSGDHSRTLTLGAEGKGHVQQPPKGGGHVPPAEHRPRAAQIKAPELGANSG